MSNLVITQRDRKLLARVSDFGLLSTRQIEAMVFRAWPRRQFCEDSEGSKRLGI